MKTKYAPASIFVWIMFNLTMPVIGQYEHRALILKTDNTYLKGYIEAEDPHSMSDGVYYFKSDNKDPQFISVDSIISVHINEEQVYMAHPVVTNNIAHRYLLEQIVTGRVSYYLLHTLRGERHFISKENKFIELPDFSPNANNAYRTLLAQFTNEQAGLRSYIAELDYNTVSISEYLIRYNSKYTPDNIIKNKKSLNLSLGLTFWANFADSYTLERVTKKQSYQVGFETRIPLASPSGAFTLNTGLHFARKKAQKAQIILVQRDGFGRIISGPFLSPGEDLVVTRIGIPLYLQYNNINRIISVYGEMGAFSYSQVDKYTVDNNNIDQTERKFGGELFGALGIAINLDHYAAIIPCVRVDLDAVMGSLRVDMKF